MGLGLALLDGGDAVPAACKAADVMLQDFSGLIPESPGGDGFYDHAALGMRFDRNDFAIVGEGTVAEVVAILELFDWDALAPIGLERA